MTEKSNIRFLRITVITLVLLFALTSLTLGQAIGRYSTKIPNELECIASNDTKLYVMGIYPVQDEASGEETSEETSDETSDEEAVIPSIYAFERDELFLAPSWKTKGGEQYITFTVANNYDSQVPDQDISFRIRAILADANGDESENESFVLNFSIEENGNKYFSRIDNINQNTDFFESKNISGWLFRFCETINDEVLYTLKGKGYDEITFTVAVRDTEFDCSSIMIYIDRIN